MTTLEKKDKQEKAHKKLLTKKLFLQKLIKQKDKKFHKVENNLPIKLNPYFGK